MIYPLPKLGQEAIALNHFPTRQQAFIFRAYEYVEPAKIAQVLKTTEEKVRKAAADMGLPEYNPGNVWLNNGYITIIRSMWHILPYEQLLELLDMDEEALGIVLREDDFLSVKLGDKPVCEPIYWQELTEEQKLQTAEIKKVMETVDLKGVAPFDFKYNIPEIKFEGEERFKTRMIYAFSGLFLHAFDVDSREFCPDEQLEAYRKLGVNGIWTQGILSQLTEFPFEPSISKGYEKRLERMRDFVDRLEKYGIKLYLYINEPRFMPPEFFDKFPHIKGHQMKSPKACLCTSTPEVQNYLKDNIEALCRAVPKLGGLFTITRSENVTNCYSHSLMKYLPDPPTCPRCSKRGVGEVIGEVIDCIAEGARRVSPDIKVMAWSWSWGAHREEIIRHLPKDVILFSQSELSVPFNIGGVEGEVRDYSMSIIGPGEHAKQEWQWAKECGLELGAKVQINTTWEASTVPALPVYPSIEEHIGALKDEGVEHLLLSWTLGGYPGLNIAHAAKYFYEKVTLPEENEKIKEAANLFVKAFSEFPFHIGVLYKGPQNAGPSNLLYEKPTGYTASMTCYAYDDLESWRSDYPVDVFEDQFAKLCTEWEKGLALLENEPENETVIMAKAAYALFKSSLNQIRFIRARDKGDKKAALAAAKAELEITRLMLDLMNKNASIGYEAANHYYFSKGQLAEKIVNCYDIIRKYM